jgi:phosphocarrier protein
MVVVNPLGLHARPAAMFVKTAAKFDSDIMVEKDGYKVTGKSIMGLITLEACKGTRLKISADGPDASEALDALEAVLNTDFNEEGS